MKTYTGIGSRQTPPPALKLIVRVAEQLAKADYILRSGGADGADDAFEIGCDKAHGRKEIYLPWKGFNGHPSPYYYVTKEALELAESVHPVWDKCSQGARKLHGRNCYQLLGLDLNKPSDFVVCWTSGGQLSGGTATVLRLAADRDVPIYNLSSDSDVKKLGELLNYEFDLDEGYAYFF